jgi:hypothetical protein
MVVADWADPDGWCGLGDLARLDTTDTSTSARASTE